MAQSPQTKTNSKMASLHSRTLKAILKEIRLLRNEVMLLLPQEDLEDYAHPDRIDRSYRKALEKYPPLSI